MVSAKRIAVARGEGVVDLLLVNAQLVNVLDGSIYPASVAVHSGRIVGFGDYEAAETVDLEGRFLCPGFIDGHLHLESSMLAIPEFARNVVPRGTTAVVADPHEIANVVGIDGIRYILDSSEGLALRVFIMFPSCVPATPFETSGATLSAADMMPFRDHPRVLGLAEMMNFPGAVAGDPEILQKIDVFSRKVKDGHAPGLSGKLLNAYITAGITSDHECTTLEEAREKLRSGMRIMIREGSAAKNLDALLPVVNKHNSRFCLLVSDDLDPLDILEKGHLNALLGKAVARGLDPIRAVQMVTLNPATYFGLKDLGAVAPGFRADFVVLDDLASFRAHSVYVEGALVAREGRFLGTSQDKVTAVPPGGVNLDWDKLADLSLPCSADRVNVIEVVPGQIVTRHIVDKPARAGDRALADPIRDLLKIAVIERHHATGNYAVGLIRGFGLKRGALASTVAHDSHNILVIAASDDDMMVAVREIAAMGGGMVVVDSGAVVARLPLPIGGLMSDRPIAEVVSGLHDLERAAAGLGCTIEAPFATMSFMALTPIPELKMSDRGLFDSVHFQFIPVCA